MAKVALDAGLEAGVCTLPVVFTTPVWAADSVLVSLYSLQLPEIETDRRLSSYLHEGITAFSFSA